MTSKISSSLSFYKSPVPESSPSSYMAPSGEPSIYPTPASTAASISDSATLVLSTSSSSASSAQTSAITFNLMAYDSSDNTTGADGTLLMGSTPIGGPLGFNLALPQMILTFTLNSTTGYISSGDYPVVADTSDTEPFGLGVFPLDADYGYIPIMCVIDLVKELSFLNCNIGGSYKQWYLIFWEGSTFPSLALGSPDVSAEGIVEVITLTNVLVVYSGLD